MCACGGSRRVIWGLLELHRLSCMSSPSVWMAACLWSSGTLLSSCGLFLCVPWSCWYSCYFGVWCACMSICVCVCVCVFYISRSGLSKIRMITKLFVNRWAVLTEWIKCLYNTPNSPLCHRTCTNTDLVSPYFLIPHSHRGYLREIWRGWEKKLLNVWRIEVENGCGFWLRQNWNPSAFLFLPSNLVWRGGRDARA